MSLCIILHQPRRLDEWGLQVYLTSFYTDRIGQLLAPAALFRAESFQLRFGKRWCMPASWFGGCS